MNIFITGLRTIEREIVINELDLSELKNYFDEEEQMLTSEKPSKENLMKTVVVNILNETNVSLQEAAYFSNDSSDERLEYQETESVSLNLHHFLNTTVGMQRLLEVSKHLSMVSNCLNGSLRI